MYVSYKLICASNANHVLTDFLQTGVYDISRRRLIKTPSPSMDILIASNIERLLDIITNDPQKVSQWMQKLKEQGKFTVDEKTKNILGRDFSADWVSNQDCLQNIKQVFQASKSLLDPHTAVAQKAAERYSRKTADARPVIICATAHWAKFAGSICQSLTGDKAATDGFPAIETVLKLTSISSIPENIQQLKNKLLRSKTAEYPYGQVSSLLRSSPQPAARYSRSLNKTVKFTQKCRADPIDLEKKLKQFLKSICYNLKIKHG